MVSRREFMTMSAAAAAILGPGRAGGLAAQGRLDQDALLAMRPVGNVTILHVTDIHAQLVPIYYREPSTNLGVGPARGIPPHITGKTMLEKYGLAPGSAQAYAFTDQDFDALARVHGKVGGLDRMATLVGAIRAERQGRTLLLEGGDSLQGSWTALQTKGGDMARALKQLGIEATTGHWEFTYGAERVQELIEAMGCPFLAGNVVDTEWEEPVFESTAYFERGGVKIAVIGQAFPYTPVANPKWMFPKWSFGIREEKVKEHVDAARAEGAGLVVLLSHNGFDVDRKLASRVPGIDVILTAHTHDALPAPVMEGKTLLIASGCSGKFLSRLDLDVQGGEVKDFAYRLIPIFADAIRPDPEMTRLVEEIRRPFAAEIGEVIGRTETTLYRRGNFQGTWDDVICRALMERREAEIAFSPAFRWGTSLLAGQDITMDDLWSETAMTYPQVYRTPMTGTQIKDILEDVADNIFNTDPYYQGGGDMVRVGGLAFTIDVDQTIGKRISRLTHLASGASIEAAKSYMVAGWASVAEGVEGPPVWELVAADIRARKVIQAQPMGRVEVIAG